MGRKRAPFKKSRPSQHAPNTSSSKKKSHKKRILEDHSSHPHRHVQNTEVDRVLGVTNKLLLDDVDDGAVPNSQIYFRAREGAQGGKNSGKRICDLDLVEEPELRDALLKVPIKHKEEQAAVFDSYKVLYPKWHFQLSCGFGLLMYGFGSKKALLEDFALSTLTDGAAVVVNGYLPTINIKAVVLTIADALWEQRNRKRGGLKSMKLAGERPSSTNNVDELIGFLNDAEENRHVYVIVHNIDGPCLRESDAQQVLANVAGCSQIRFLASIDHINAPLLWDRRMSSTKFNWCWHNTPTYASYTAEAIHLPLLLASTRAAKSARSAVLVLQSLTPNAQSVFCTLADHQLSHPEELGLSVHKLYTLCRERFLVSSELTLRSHLTEFKDHELVRSRRGLDGQDCLFVPLPSDALTKLLEQISG